MLSSHTTYTRRQMFSMFPVAPIALYVERPLPAEFVDWTITFTVINPFVLRNFCRRLIGPPVVDLPLIRRPRMDVVHIPRRRDTEPAESQSTAGALVLRGPRHVDPRGPRDVVLRGHRHVALREPPDVNLQGPRDVVLRGARDIVSLKPQVRSLSLHCYNLLTSGRCRSHVCLPVVS